MLYEYDGENAAASRLADEYFETDSAEWQRATINDAQLMYANAEPSPLVEGILAILDECRIVVDWPITFPTDERIAVTLIGANDEIQRALSAVPEEVSRNIDRAGDYRRERDGLLSKLTPRERAVVAAAVDAGYYRNPREANYADLAATLDRSTGTVGEHLRNAEAKLMAALCRDREPTGSRPLEST